MVSVSDGGLSGGVNLTGEVAFEVPGRRRNETFKVFSKLIGPKSLKGFDFVCFGG